MKVYFACRASLIWFPKYAKNMAKNCCRVRDSVGKNIIFWFGNLSYETAKKVYVNFQGTKQSLFKKNIARAH